ncbi:MAG TPA: hypothetical protein PKK15_22065 [Kouleothrix sp.]|nr:hypothetical protein [Kouleothrix sp.]
MSRTIDSRTNFQLAVQLDTAAFPGHAITDISADVISADVDLSIDADNGACTVVLHRLDAAAAENVRLYVYAGWGSTTLIFNGQIAGIAWNANGTYTLTGQDAMARLRFPWTRDDRAYAAATAESVVQNLVEASGIDSSLTSIAGDGWLIGVAADVVLHGGSTITETGAAGPCDVPLELIRRIDEANGLWRTYSRGDGAVYRTLRTVDLIGGAIYYTDGTPGGDNPAWQVERRRDATRIINAVKVNGASIADVPLESLAQAASAWIPDPPAYNSLQLDAPLVEDQTHADALAAALLAEYNGRLNIVTFETPLDATLCPGGTIQINSARRDLVAQRALVTSLHHHCDGRGGVSSVTCEFREA